MTSLQESYISYKNSKPKILVYTLGKFQVIINGNTLIDKDWGRDKTLQLIQFFITSRHQFGLHKEIVIDRIWNTDDLDQGRRNFKVALHGIRKVMEPNRKTRNEASYISRQGSTYKLETDNIWIDADALDYYVKLGNQALHSHKELAIEVFNEVINLYQGIYLPNRLYEDWSAAERERLQIQALNSYMVLAELLLEENPRECIRLAQSALMIDNTWEEAYRIQMQAYLSIGNRPQAIKVYNNCVSVLDEEFGINPLPETKNIMQKILLK